MAFTLTIPTMRIKVSKVSLRDAIGLSVNEWFGGSVVDVYATVDAGEHLKKISKSSSAGSVVSERAETITLRSISEATFRIIL
jgi:hypothetical protein